MDPEKSEGILRAIEAVLAETLESYKKVTLMTKPPLGGF